MKLLVITRADKDIEFYTQYTHPRMRAYAKKCNADFQTLDHDPSILTWDKRPHFRILTLYELFEKYDRILHLDSDMIVMDNCPNLFDIVSYENVGVVYEDVGETERIKNRRGKMKAVQKAWGDIGWRENYINSGTLLTSRPHRDMFQPFEGRYWTEDGSVDIHLGYMINKLGYEVFPLPFQFNHMSLFSRKWNGNPKKWDSHIIHYAGGAFRKKELVKDIRKLK